MIKYKKHKVEDFINKQYGRLTISSFEIINSNMLKSTVKCLCSCGNEILVKLSSLTTGNTKSCGCFRKENTKKLNLKHGLRKSLLYGTWLNMKDRCYNKNNKNYKDYGGRGVKVCEEWFNNFETFHNWCGENGYSKNLTLDRIDFNGNYSPENCRWVDMHMQNTNKKIKNTNTSGYTGVSFHKGTKKWASYICIYGKSKHLGVFNTKEDAVIFRNKYIIDNGLKEYKIQKLKNNIDKQNTL